MHLPIEVSVHISVRSLEFLDPLKNEYKVQMLIHQEWEDTRLSYAQLNPPKRLRYLTVLDTRKIWRPDLYFFNEKSTATSYGQQDRSFARIAPTGKGSCNSFLPGEHTDVSVRLTKMSFQNGKWSVGILLLCSWKFLPYTLSVSQFLSTTHLFSCETEAFSREDVILKWKNQGNPVEVNQDFALMPGLAYHSITHDTSDIQTETGVYSCLSGGFVFNRLKGYYWKQLYIPCTCLVVLGWLSFLLDATGVPGVVRAILVGVTWSVAYLKISDFHHVMPKVAYSTAFDIWTGMCLAFIFVSVIVMILATYMANHGHTKTIPPERIQAIEARKRAGDLSAQYALNQKSNCLSASFVVDRILVFFYPILFAAFGVGYFTVYLKLARMNLDS
ncbi:Glutamate-gated chloride channel [Orchesella cincta]|uniref:Glutamate-gated chloride channel n=1 Tax=Orchesella cincta TaxID=48709 RepID=A0A1D2NIT5_ORCCI|nr:Glutamate-gated chloride channel [Orchesella cincta]